MAAGDDGTMAASARTRRHALARARLFDQDAERYDRCRPRYPKAAIDAVLGPEPSGLEVLDVGCGTGIASCPIAARGANVLGVELAPRMAAIARRRGIDVEMGAFEDWDATGRTFDRIVSGQAWHWLDMVPATAKAASLLRPGGRLCLLYNGGAPPDDLADVLGEVYSTVLPAGTHRVFRAYAANRSTDVREGLTPVRDALAATSDLAPATERWLPWTRRYQRDEWLDLMLSNSEYIALDPWIRRRLLDSIGSRIDDYGGSFLVSFETVLITAVRLD